MKQKFSVPYFIGTTLFALQQLSGINSVFYFSSTVFISVGVPSSLANICMGIANLSGEPIETLMFHSYFVIPTSVTFFLKIIEV
jgi:hypothetical protein